MAYSRAMAPEGSLPIPDTPSEALDLGPDPSLLLAPHQQLGRHEPRVDQVLAR